MSFTIIIWILVFFGIFYFLAIRPQRRQKQQHAEMISMLKKGDEVVTIGGMFGTVSAIGDDWVELEVAKRTRVRYLKRADLVHHQHRRVRRRRRGRVHRGRRRGRHRRGRRGLRRGRGRSRRDGEVAVDEAVDETPDAPDAPEAPKA